MNRDPLGYYAWLGVPPEATADEVKAAFRARARRLHPDVSGTGNAEAFRGLSEAYHVISDPARRARYDRTALAPEAAVTDGIPPRWTVPLRPEPARRSGLRATGLGLALCAACAAAVFAFHALESDAPAAVDPQSRTFAADTSTRAPDTPTPALGGDATAYVLPEGGPAALWGGVPGRRIVRLGSVPAFTPVHAEALVVDGLQAVALADGHLAYIDAARLMPGTRRDARQAGCAYVAGVPPANGEVLERGAEGGSRLVIVNHEPSAAVVTLRKGGVLAARVYVAPDQRADLAGLPPGPWSAQSALGELWSRGCDRFVADWRERAEPGAVRQGGQLVISPDN